MTGEINGKFGNLGNKPIFGQNTTGAKGKKEVTENVPIVQDNKANKPQTNDLLDTNGFYNSLGLSLGNIKKPDLNAQITNIVGANVMKRVAAASPETVENVSTTANFAYDDILADDTQALFAMAGLNSPVNAPSLEAMQKNLNDSKLVSALFA